MSSKIEQDFYDWKQKVDNYIYDLIQVHLYDLPDNTFRLDFDAGYSYQQMADKVVKDTEWTELYWTLKNV
jgi:hypothetical protein